MLRRTAFKRKVYVPEPVAPLRPITESRGVLSMSSQSVVAVPKMHLLRSESYRRWVASLPCCACGIEGFGQCAHSNQAKHGKAKSQKAGDQFTFSLCSTRPGHMGHHYEHDNCIGMTKAERDYLEDEYIARTQALARAAGRQE